MDPEQAPPPPANLLSAVVITYNRERLIGTCLSALRFADEIIVVDKSSTDNTPAIARQLADRVITVPWSPVVETTRGLAIASCKHDWILCLDDDECISVEAIKFIRNELLAPRAEAYFLPQRHYILGTHDERAYYWPEHHARLFHRGAVEWGSTVHQGFKVTTDRTFKVSADDGICIHHLSHRSVSDWIEKSNRYTSQADRVLMAPLQNDLIAHAHRQIDAWTAKSSTDPAGYASAVGILRALYDIIDQLKLWENDRGYNGDLAFSEICARLNELYADHFAQFPNQLKRRQVVAETAIVAPAESALSSVSGQRDPQIDRLHRDLVEERQRTMQEHSAALAMAESLATLNRELARLHSAMDAQQAAQEVLRIEKQQLEFEITPLAGLREKLQQAESSATDLAILATAHETDIIHLRLRVSHLHHESSARFLRIHAADRRCHRGETRQLIEARRLEVYRDMADASHSLAVACRPGRNVIRRAGRRFKEWKIVRSSRLFDADFYRRQAPKSALAQTAPAWHYVLYGNAAGLDPHPLFSTRFYHRHHPDVAQAGRNCMVHFLSMGADAYSPHPLFDTTFYRQHSPDVAANGLNPLQHYLTHGAGEDRMPCYLFDSAYYRAQNADVTGFNGTPLEHYLAIGWRRGARPHPLFDPAYYDTQRDHRSLEPANPLEHFLTLGSRLYLSPHPLFDPEFYINYYPDLKDYREPFLHALRHGLAERRKPHPLFDTQFYVDTYPAAARPGVDPLLHYLASDMRINKPSPVFDPGFYIDANPEAATTGQSPLIHYLTTTAARQTRPHPLFDPVYYHAVLPDAARSPDAPLLHWLNSGHLEAAGPSALFDSRHYCHQAPALDQVRIDPLQYAAQHPREPHRTYNCGHVDPLALEVAQTLDHTRLQGTLLEMLRSVSLPAPMGEPTVSIVIPYYNHLDHTLRCLNAVSKNTAGENYEVILIDDCSTDADAALLANIPGIRYIRNQTNLGFLRTCNKAAAAARGTFLVMLNNDTAPMPGWLTQLRQTFAHFPDAGLVGSMLLYPDGRLQEAGGVIWADGRGWNFGRLQQPEHPDFNYVRDVCYCSGAAIMLPRQLWDQLGGFDELFLPAYYEDSDLAFRVRQAGHRVLYQPFSRVIHFEGISSGTDTATGVKKHQALNQPKFFSRWGRTLETYGNDPDPRRHFLNRTNIGQILVVDSCTPTPDKDAGSALTFNLIRILRSLGYGVTFLPVDNFLHFGTYTEDLQRLGVECIYQPFAISLEAFLTEQGRRFDGVFLYRVTNADPYTEMVRRLAPQAKIIFHTVDLHFVRQEREALLNESPIGLQRAAVTKGQELGAMRKADATVVVSASELQTIERLLPSIRSYHLPIPSDVPGRSRHFGQRSDVVFIGGFQHTPNKDAVRWLATEIWPRVAARLPGVKLHIVGSPLTAEIEALAGENIVVRGFVPELSDVFDHCRISVAPLRYGAGAKGKVITTLAFGVPAVVTSIASEGMGLKDGEHALVADDAAEFADKIVQLYTSETLWNRLSENGLRLVQDHYSIAAVRQKLLALLSDLGLPAAESQGVTKR